MRTLLALAVVTGCATPAAVSRVARPAPAADAAVVPTTPPPPVVTPPAPAATTIAIAYDAPRDRWRVTWSVGVPATALRFDRIAAAGPRGASWQIEPALVWRRDGDRDVLAAADGAPRTEFAAEFATDDASPDRLPPLHLVWTDGSRLLHLGAVAADGEVCTADRCGRRAAGRRWRLVAPGLTVRIGAHVDRDRVAWDEAADAADHGYAYVGDGTARAIPGGTLVIDRGVPRWLATLTAELVPAAVADFTARTGIAHDAPITVYVSRRPGAGGYAVRGRTLPAQLQLEAGGAAWSRRTTDGARLWRELVVHEVFHLWNGQLARRAERADEWLSEGASAFVAGVALRDARLLDAARWSRRVVAAGNRCARSLAGPLHADDADPSYYACGEVIHAALDHALADGVWPLYADLFALARSQGSYATADLLTLARAAGVEAAVVARVEEVLVRGLGAAPERAVAALLADAGLATTVVPGRRGRPPRLRWVAPRRRRGGSVAP